MAITNGNAELVLSLLSIPGFRICNCAFASWEDLETITILSTIVSIGDYAFSCLSQLKEVIFESPSSVETIGSYVFAYTRSLKKIILPSSLSVIEDSTFEESQSLEEVIIPSSVTKHLNFVIERNSNSIKCNNN